MSLLKKTRMTVIFYTAVLFTAISAPVLMIMDGWQDRLSFVVVLIAGGLAFSLVLSRKLDKLLLNRLLLLSNALQNMNRAEIGLRVPVEGDDELAELAGRINDMVDFVHESHGELRDNEEKFRRIFSQSPLGIVILDMEGRPQDANRAFLEMFGVSRVEDLQRYVLFSDPNIPPEIHKKLMANRSVHFDVDYDFDQVLKKSLFSTAKRGHCFLEYIITPFRETALTASGFMGQIQNVTRRKETEQQLKFLSYYDSLTGLYNRACFENEIRSLENIDDKLVGVIMADVDGLKLVNDTFGHEAGDLLLTAAAKVLRESFRKEDMIARIGGDEFAVLLPGKDMTDTEKASERIREAVSRYNIVHRPSFPLSISIGLAAGDITWIGIDQLIKEADNNMYREKLHHSQSTRSEIVKTLMRALKARDGITEGHGDRLREFVERIGRAAGVMENQIHDLRLFAQFHDIGKVGVPDKILFKPSKLDAEETKEMQRHCEIGFRIAQSSKDLTPIADLILHHHEWWNGSGYPMGMKGDKIPLGCRILAIADAYDAMTNNRPYRKALSHQQAMAELEKGAGQQFDPHLVKMFAELMQSGKEASQTA